MNDSPINPWIHRIAVLTVVLAVLPIFMGAMTTTKRAGMVFPDWPTSDGVGMFQYPFLSLVQDLGTDPKTYAQFLEHGHRLAGILIGLASIGLAVVCYLPGSTKTLKILGVSVLLAVIGQGLIGGFRVLEAMPELAMLHGLFASLVFALMCTTAAVASPRWQAFEQNEEYRKVGSAKYAALIFTLFLLMQYALGGMIRHPVSMSRVPIPEHLGFGVLALLFVHVVLYLVIRTKVNWLRSAMRVVLILVGVQVLLGFLTYAMKFGVPSMGIVAVLDSTGQVFSRTGHMMTGVFLIAAATVLTVKVFRVSYLMNRGV